MILGQLERTSEEGVAPGLGGWRGGTFGCLSRAGRQPPPKARPLPCLWGFRLRRSAAILPASLPGARPSRVSVAGCLQRQRGDSSVLASPAPPWRFSIWAGLRGAALGRGWLGEGPTPTDRADGSRALVRVCPSPRRAPRTIPDRRPLRKA